MAAGALWVALGTALLRYFGVGGYRSGFWICLAVLAAGPVVLLVTVPAGERRPALQYLAALVLVAGAAASWLLGACPPSSSRLAERLDQLSMPFYELVDERHGGSSTCRPRCPVVLRTYRGPATGVRAAMVNTAVALDGVGLLGPPRLRRTFTDRPLNERVDGLRVRAQATRGDDGIRLILELRAT